MKIRPEKKFMSLSAVQIYDLHIFLTELNEFATEFESTEKIILK